MRIIAKEGKIFIDTPYNPRFVSQIKLVGGRWDANSKTWVTDERNLEQVREIMRTIYGMDDRPQKLVSVRIQLIKDLIADRGPIIIFGRIVASAKGRDTGSDLGAGIVLEYGTLTSGGSMQYWETIVRSNSSFIIHDVPETAVIEKLNWNDKYGTLEILDFGVNYDALKKEKELLLSRIAEIDKLLEKQDNALE